MLEALEVILVQALAVIVPAVSALVVAWLRAKTQKQVVEQATIEAEAAGHRDGLDGGKKKELALTLSSTRMGAFTRPSPERLDAMVEEAVPIARASVRPPKSDDP